MEKQYCFDISFPKVDFDSIEPNSEKCPKFFHAHLIVRENEIEIRLFYKFDTKFEWKFDYWLRSINWNQFGEFISTSNFTSNERVKSISFSESKLLSLRNGSNQVEKNLNYVSLFVDWVMTDWILNEEEKNTAEFYLNDAGFNMVSHFYAPMFGFDGKYEINRMQGKDKFYKIGTTEFRPEFNFCNSDKKSSNEAKIIKEPKLQFNISNDTLIEELLENVELVCLISLFYYKLKIDYSFARIHLNDKTITIKKILDSQINKVSGSSSLWSVKYYNQFDVFLNLNWQKGGKENLKKLRKAIQKFYQSTIVDGSSSFLLRYNIIEICKGGNKKGNEKFKKILKDEEHKEKYNEALDILLNTVSLKDAEDFKKKWKKVTDILEYRPMKSDIDEFFRSQKLNSNEFPISVSKLVQIRSDLTHGSVNRVKETELEKANILLYRLSVILILNLLGLNDIWEFDKEIK